MACAPEHGTSGRRNITGLFQHSEAVDRDWNPGGLWRTVRLHETGPVRIDRLRVLCRDADESRAHLRLHARLDAAVAGVVRLRTSCDGDIVGETEHTLAEGGNEIDWALDLAEPKLWWPHALGAQPLTTIVVDVIVDDETSDSASRRTGLREVAWSSWIARVNGERIFIKGANILPTRPGLADATPEAVRRDVELAVETGLDGVRVQAHIAPNALYDAADELGLLLLQDFPLQWGYAAQHPPSRGRPGARGRRRARPPPVDHPVVRPRRTGRRGPRARRRFTGAPRGALHAPAAAELEQERARPLGEAGVREGRPDTPDGRARRRAARTSRNSTAPTATCGSAGIVARCTSWPIGQGHCRDWCAS